MPLTDDDFAEFVAGAAPRLRRTAYLLCRDWHLAQDLTQTTFARMYSRRRKLGEVGDLTAYSRKVLMSVLFDHQRRRSGSEVVVDRLPDRGAVTPSGELHVELMRALATLPVRDQAIVVLRHWEDRSVDSVAAILGVSVSVVKMQNMRALTRLRALLGEDFVMS